MNKNKLLIKFTSVALLSSVISLGSIGQISSAMLRLPMKLTSGGLLGLLKKPFTSSASSSVFIRGGYGRNPIRYTTETNSGYSFDRGGFGRTPVRFPDSSRKNLPKFSRRRVYGNGKFEVGRANS